MRIDSIYLREVGPFDDVRIDLPEGTNPDLADVYLLTGPNGCGKSTVLYAIAAAIMRGEEHLGQDQITTRLRTSNSIAAIAAGERHTAAAWQYIDKRWRTTVTDPFGGNEDLSSVSSPKQFVAHYGSRMAHLDHGYETSAGRFHTEPSDAHSRFDWAAFAYSGARVVEDVAVDAIQEIKTSPFLNSLDFGRSADSQLLVNWLAGQEYKRLKADAAGNDARARQLAQSIADIEAVVSQITGAAFEFHMADEDNNVRVKQDGKIVPLRVLPTGLQAIVSWVADLLMRLDRIPWVNDTPPMRRSFLLLLDEIDIHLHPAWQRKIIPIVQKLFPKAQIIATTHSPFVVASADDAYVFQFDVDSSGVSRLKAVEKAPIGSSVSAVMLDVFGIQSEFDIATEEMFTRFHDAKRRLLTGATADRNEVDEIARAIAERSHEAGQIIGFELRQIDRQLAKRSATG